jgi:hypothetical protein
MSNARGNRFCNGWEFMLKTFVKSFGISMAISHALIHGVSHVFLALWFLCLQSCIGWMYPQLAGLSPEESEICSRSLVDVSISKSWLWSPIGSDHYRFSIPLADHCECSSARFQKTQLFVATLRERCAGQSQPSFGHHSVKSPGSFFISIESG